MIRIYTGNDRVKAKQEIEKYLGTDYEVVEGADITVADMPTVLMGGSLFTAERRVLIRDLTANKAAYEELEKYLGTPHRVALLEEKLDRRTATFKALSDKVEVYEYKLPEVGAKKIFDIYGVAKRDGVQAVKMLREVKITGEPVMFMGLLVSRALKDFAAHPGVREKRMLKELAAADLAMKTTGVDPWLIIECLLARMATF